MVQPQKDGELTHKDLMQGYISTNGLNVSMAQQVTSLLAPSEGMIRTSAATVEMRALRLTFASDASDLAAQRVTCNMVVRRTPWVHGSDGGHRQHGRNRRHRRHRQVKDRCVPMLLDLQM